MVGLGHQSTEDHIPAILASEGLVLSGVADPVGERAVKWGTELGVPYAPNVSELLKRVVGTPEVAVVAVPHSQYMDVISCLAEAGIHVIKEKPFAVSIAEALAVKELVNRTNICLFVTLQRRFNPIYLSFAQLVRRIGRVHAIEGRYTMNVERLDEGWRASQLHAGGGVLVDLGYHYVDLIVWYFGLPDFVSCRVTGGNRPFQNYDTEDTAFVQFGYLSANSGSGVLGSLIVSRVYPDREESLVAYGTTGSVGVSRGRCQRRNTDGAVVEYLAREGAWPSALVDQLEHFALSIRTGISRGDILVTYLQQVAFVEAAYRSATCGSPIDPHELIHALEA